VTLFVTPEEDYSGLILVSVKSGFNYNNKLYSPKSVAQTYTITKN